MHRWTCHFEIAPDFWRQNGLEQFKPFLISGIVVKAERPPPPSSNATFLSLIVA
jgi:hypothetical protein